MIIDVREEQLRKAPDPSVVSSSGSAIEVSDSQPWKAYVPIVVSPLGNVTVVR